MRFKHLETICEIDTLPGCSQVAIFHSVYVPIQLRKQGLGGRAHKARLEEARKLGYQVAICTVDDSNGPQNTILEDNNWNKVQVFKSEKTGHLVGLWVKGL